MTRIPPPETKRALLVAEGAVRATEHVYDGYREIETRSLDKRTPSARQFEYLFKCSATGRLRRWGVAAIEVRS